GHDQLIRQPAQEASAARFPKPFQLRDQGLGIVGWIRANLLTRLYCAKLYCFGPRLMVKYSTGRLLNTREAAKFLRVSEASIRRWSDSGLLAARRVGRRRERRFHESDLQGFMQQPASSAARAHTVNVGGGAGAVPGHR